MRQLFSLCNGRHAFGVLERRRHCSVRRAVDLARRFAREESPELPVFQVIPGSIDDGGAKWTETASDAWGQVRCRRGQ